MSAIETTTTGGHQHLAGTNDIEHVVDDTSNVDHEHPGDHRSVKDGQDRDHSASDLPDGRHDHSQVRCVGPTCSNGLRQHSRHHRLQPTHAGPTPRAGATAQCNTRVGRDAASVATLAREHSVSSWAHLADAAGIVHQGRATVTTAAMAAGHGIDETSFLAAHGAHLRSYVTGLVDLQRSRLLDIIEGNRGADVARWRGRRPKGWKAGVEVVATDPTKATAGASRPPLDHASLVADPFHIVALADHRTVDKLRRRVQQAPRTRLPLTGGVARCGVCGANLVSYPRQGKRNYSCPKRSGERGCGGVRALAEPLDALVRDAIAGSHFMNTRSLTCTPIAASSDRTVV
ncbi:MAG: transposase [Actinomycetota bacterium]|nr:transposase [Actinomycetota bacterium]